MITSTLVMPVIALSTLATLIYIGIGFLPRPSKTSVLWSAAFTVTMIGSYVWLAQELVQPELMRALGTGIILGAMPLVWSGLRAYRDQPRSFVGLSVALLCLFPLSLMIGTSLGVYGIAFRVVFFVVAVFAGLTIAELMQLGPLLRDEALPLMGIAAVLGTAAIIYVVNGVFLITGQITPEDSLRFIRTLNMIGIPVYIVCALVTTLLLTIKSNPAHANRSAFESTVITRLQRAEAAGDQWWSLLDIRLDDPDLIRTATSTAAYNAVTDRFGHDVDAVLPADADLRRLSATRVVALVPRAQGGVREMLPQLLERVSSDEADHAPMRVTASVGWAPVSAVGYDFGTLLARAGEAAQVAHDAGGDRWERVRGEAQ